MGDARSSGERKRKDLGFEVFMMEILKCSCLDGVDASRQSLDES